MKNFLLLITCVCPAGLWSQHIGIGTTNPTEPLEVSGIIYANEGGIKFPDNTVQTTAAYMADPENAAPKKPNAIVKFDAINGPVDSAGITGGFLVYDFSNAFQKVYTMGGGGGGGIGPLQHLHTNLIIEVHADVVPLFAEFLLGAQNPLVRIRLLEQIGNSTDGYFEVRLAEAYTTEVSMQMKYTGNGEYAHLIYLGLEAEGYA